MNIHVKIQMKLYITILISISMQNNIQQKRTLDQITPTKYLTYYQTMKQRTENQETKLEFDNEELILVLILFSFYCVVLFLI